MLSTLVLDQGYQPHRIVGWPRAATLVYEGTAEVLETDDATPIRTIAGGTERDAPSAPMREWFARGAAQNRDTIVVYAPSVVRLLRAVGRKRVVRFSRLNVMTRDAFTCQYCGTSLPMEELTYDHVVPRSKGGRTEWQNIVTSCRICNLRKGNRLLSECGMVLRRAPLRPVSLPIVAIRPGSVTLRDEWKTYWYWNVGLES